MPASPNITFAKDAVSVTVPGPPGATDAPSLPRFVTDLSANYTRWTYTLTTTKKRNWSIQLMDLTAQQKIDLQSFFEDTAKGPNESFTYTHTDGTSHTVVFVDTKLDWQRVNGTQWGTSFRLETTTEIS